MEFKMPKPKKGGLAPNLDINSQVKSHFLTPDEIEEARLNKTGGFEAKIETIKIKKSKK